MPKRSIFKGFTVAVACPLGGQWTDANISRWVSQRKGVFTSAMTEKVTHLICPIEEFKKQGPIVKAAVKLGAKKCRIVTLDWLEDSIMKNRKLSENDYLVRLLLKGEADKKKQDAREKGVELEKRFVNPNLWHLYSDSTYFKYNVHLTRDDPEHGWHGQRYELYIFESNAKPHLYSCAVKFLKKHKDNQPSYHRLSETAQSFDTEYTKFKTIFLKKTGIEWDERLVKTNTTDDSLFKYQPPTGGKPVGWVPERFLRRASPPAPVAVEHPS